MKKYDYYVGIDPDVKKSGFAIVHNGRVIFTDTYDFATLIHELRTLRWNNVLVIVEASWLLTSNWHMAQRYGSTARAASLGRSVGMNHATGMHIVECARAIGFDVIEQTPLRKIGSARDGKLRQEDAEYYMTGLSARTNQEERDAARLAWVAAGLPERIRPRTHNG